MAKLRAVAVFCALVVPSSVHAYEVRRTPTGAEQHWKARQLELRVDPRLSSEAAAEAIAAWRDASGVPDLEIAGPIRSLPLIDSNEHGIYLVPEWTFGNALAVTVTTSRDEDGEILDSDVLVSLRDDLRVVGNSGSGNSYDLTSVLTHELGHVLGLDESEVRSATMFPRTPRGSIEQRTLDEDDEDGVAAIYSRMVSRDEPIVAAGGCSAGTGARASGLLVLLSLALMFAPGRKKRALAFAGSGAFLLLVAFDAQPHDQDGSRLALVRNLAGGPQGEVRASEVSLRDGLWVTRSTVRTSDGDRVIEVPGGSHDGLTQDVSGFVRPEVGERVAFDSSGHWAISRGDLMWGGNVGTRAVRVVLDR